MINPIAIPAGLPGVLLITPKTFADARGYFQELFHRDENRSIGITCDFVQSSHSHSIRDVLRGLHFQKNHPQAKLVTVIRGCIFDVVVDIREGSPTFGQHLTVELSDTNHRQLFIPAGFAHGYCVISDQADVIYYCSDFYDPSGERGILWNDPLLAIPWPIKQPILSPKDAAHPLLLDALRPQVGNAQGGDKAAQ